MKLGFALPYCGSWATPDNQLAVARRAEELGYASLWTAQRLLMPTEPVNEYYAAPGAPWPAVFRSVADPIVSLAFVAAATSRIRLGTATLVLPFHDPVLLAKQLATLDVLCRGRLDVGFSLGWSKDEYAATGAPWARRGERFEEALACLKAAWGPQPASFAGEFFSLPGSTVAPGPVQRPHPPMLIGGYSDIALRRAATLADGYLGGNLPLERIVPLLDRLRGFAEEAGRDPASLRLVSRGVVAASATPAGPDRRPLTGTYAEIEADVARYAAAGLDELFLDLNFDPRVGVPEADPAESLARAMEVLERLAGFAAHAG